MRGSIIAWVTPLAAAMAMAGCGTTEIGGPIDSRGSYPDFGTGNVRHAPLGFLTIRPVQEPPEGGQGPSSMVPPGYRVYDDRGILVRRSAAGEITLPEGRYLIQLERSDRGPQTFWVLVEDGKLTGVDLNRVMDPATRAVPLQ